MKEKAGAPCEEGLFVLYLLNGQGYFSTLGGRCESNHNVIHTMVGEVEAEQVVAHIGPLPSPAEIFGRVTN